MIASIDKTVFRKEECRECPIETDMKEGEMKKEGRKWERV